jgi:hypothetical protein
MPFVTELGSPPFQLGGIGGPKLVTPIPDGLVREENSTSGHPQLHIAQAQGEVEIEPDALRNNLFRKGGNRDRGWQAPLQHRICST